MSKKIVFILILILSIGGFLRFFNLEKIPLGLNTDEASLGYNAYSILLTGMDEYGKAFPIYFRSFGNFQSPLYTYLSVPIISIFGLSVLTTRALSALSGVIIILLSFLIVYKGFKIKAIEISLTSAFVIAISPWAIFFSRIALEANLGLMLILLAFFLVISSLEKPRMLVISSLVLALSTYAYHAERILAILFFCSFLSLFIKSFIKNKKILVFSLLLFFSLQIPQFLLFNTSAFNKRFNEVNYLKEEVFLNEGGELKNIFLGKYIFIAERFTSRYISYFSPKNLFIDLNVNLSAMPNMSMFYSWMVIPLVAGLIKLFVVRSKTWAKTLLLLMFLSPIPAAITREPFYTFRTLPLFWCISITIAIGILEILRKISSLYLKMTIITIILIVSLGSFYISYFIFFKYEQNKGYNYQYIQLIKKTEQLRNVNFMVDSARVPSLYILAAFYNKINPNLIQEQSRSRQILKEYYTNSKINDNDVEVENVSFHLDWGSTCRTNLIIAGDFLAISDDQAKDHHLSLAFEINDSNGQAYLKGYSTNPFDKGCGNK